MEVAGIDVVEAPLGSLRRHSTVVVRRRSFAETPSRCPSSLRVLRRQSLPRRRPGALRNTSDAKPGRHLVRGGTPTRARAPSCARPASRAAPRRKRRVMTRQTKAQTLGSLARNRGFESTSLQRGVSNEPCGCGGVARRVGPRVRIRFAPAASLLRTSGGCRRDLCWNVAQAYTAVGCRSTSPPSPRGAQPKTNRRPLPSHPSRNERRLP